MPLDLDFTPSGRATVLRRIRRVGFAAMLMAGVTIPLLIATLLFLDMPRYYRVFLSAVALWSVILGSYAFNRLWIMAKRIIERLERLAVIDEASGSFDSLYLKLRLDEEEERTSRYGGVTTLLLVDVARLDEVIALGPQAEGEVLTGLASILAAGLRQCDVLGRLEQNEFLAILPETDRRNARLVAERLRSSVADFSYQSPDGTKVDFVRVSIGIAAQPMNGETMSSVIAAARDAADQVKAAGGNGVRVADRFVRTDEAGEQMIEQIRGEKHGSV